MTKKIAISMFFNGELEEELHERNLVESVILTKDNNVNSVLKKIDGLRRDELYSHNADDCSESCKSKGNEDNLFTALCLETKFPLRAVKVLYVYNFCPPSSGRPCFSYI